uniref:Uncharacterized protein n=1 Tax=Rhizophora mucronata TaxID=61149 RepID=A0A2P2PZB0_RHIMU
MPQLMPLIIPFPYRT